MAQSDSVEASAHPAASLPSARDLVDGDRVVRGRPTQPVAAPPEFDEPEHEAHPRVLLIDDSPAIHDDLKAALSSGVMDTGVIDRLESDLFGTPEPADASPKFEIDSAYQGQEGLARVQDACAVGRPYALAVVDMRMPPGWDGLETITRIWEVDPLIEVVICTAYSDNPWEKILATLTRQDQLLILKKPFDVVEVAQMARALTSKWRLQRERRERLSDLEALVQQRTADLAEVNETLKKEMADRARVEVELRHAQKLEAVGQLASGIAHEINTPIQYVGDSVYFLRQAFDELMEMFFPEGGRTGSNGGSLPGPPAEGADAADDDQAETLTYLREQVPRAFERTSDGIERVADIVRAMKEFAHPDSREKSEIDVNRAVQNALTVARNEYKYVAEVVTDLGSVSTVKGHAGDINQVLLNLLVNAAHAIADAPDEDGRRGTITVRTAADGDEVLISISDTGPGIPERIRHQIFDPFFTTKPVGRGTGQGLAISRSCIVDKHGGALTFEDGAEGGTTFHIRLPCDPDRESAREEPGP